MNENLQMLNILKDFHKVTGARISIHDRDSREIAAYPDTLLPFCQMLQKDDAVRLKCRLADEAAFKKARDTGKSVTYKCHCGLIETVAPIYHYGVHSGYFMMGQISDNAATSIRNIAKLSAPYFENRQTLWQNVRLIPEIDANILQSYINILSVISEYLSQSNKIAPHSRELAENIMQYIGSHFADDLSVERLCNIFGCSRTTLMNSFKHKYNITLGNYIKNLRLEKAAEMLKSNKSIKEISIDTGFSEQNYFSKVFYSKYNMPPSEYRRMQKKS